jgi:5-methylcytosine-specific restriction endonuclease McrA
MARRVLSPEEHAAYCAIRRERYAKNPVRLTEEQKAAKNAKYAERVKKFGRQEKTEEERDARREWVKQYYQANRDRLLAEKATYYQDNKEKLKAYQAMYAKENKEKVAGRSVSWRKRNPDARKAICARYRQANKEKVLVHHQNRRAAVRASGKLSADIVNKLMTLQRGKCAVCREDLEKVGKHIDHIIPIALCGSNTDDNVQLLCPTCNLSKGAKHPIEYMQQKGFLL